MTPPIPQPSLPRSGVRRLGGAEAILFIAGKTRRWSFHSCSAGSLAADGFFYSVSTAGLRCAQSAAQAAWQWFVFVHAATADSSAPAGGRGGDTAFCEE